MCAERRGLCARHPQYVPLGLSGIFFFFWGGGAMGNQHVRMQLPAYSSWWGEVTCKEEGCISRLQQICSQMFETEPNLSRLGISLFEDARGGQMQGPRWCEACAGCPFLKAADAFQFGSACQRFLCGRGFARALHQ